MNRDIVGTLLAVAVLGTAVIVPAALVGGGSPREDIYHCWA